MFRHPALFLLLSAACTAPRGPSGLSTGGGLGTSGSTSAEAHLSTGAGSSTGEGTSTGDVSAGASAGASSSEPFPDLPTMPDFGPPAPAGCKGKIDLVLLISALETMQLRQAALVSSLPGFAATLQDELEGFDVHVLSANPDGAWNGYYCQQLCGQIGSCGEYAEEYVCDSIVGNHGPCDDTRGAGLLFNAGAYATNVPCKLAGGHRYITSEEPDLASALTCIAQVGLFGQDPPLADALVDAVSPELVGSGKCNDGFLRDDALLVFLFVMDTADDESLLPPASVYEQLVAAKGGDPDAIVALGIIPPVLVGDPLPNCPYNQGPTHLREVLGQFPWHDASGNVCAESYVPFFEQAAFVVTEACGSFIPQ